MRGLQWSNLVLNLQSLIVGNLGRRPKCASPDQLGGTIWAASIKKERLLQLVPFVFEATWMLVDRAFKWGDQNGLPTCQRLSEYLTIFEQMNLLSHT